MEGITAMEEKINGFSKYDVESSARTLIDAEKIKADKRKNYFKTVIAEVAKQEKAAEEALLATKTAGRLKKVFGK